MDVYGYVINGMDPDPIKHPEDSDLFSNPVEGTEHIDPKTGLMDWEMGPAVDQELPTIIGDAISGKPAAAKRLHVDDLRTLSPKERCERIIRVLTKRYKTRAEREVAKETANQ
jgi:hypothetical protein